MDDKDKKILENMAKKVASIRQEYQLVLDTLNVFCPITGKKCRADCAWLLTEAVSSNLYIPLCALTSLASSLTSISNLISMIDTIKFPAGTIVPPSSNKPTIN